MSRDPHSYNPLERMRYKYPEGDIYEGEWSKEGHRHGLGALKMIDGAIYHGRFNQGIFHGYGSIAFPDGSQYEGEFKEGVFSGYGIYTRVDGMKFAGGFRAGIVDGTGLITFPNGSHGTPRLEGVFRGTQLLRREVATESVKKAEMCARKARDVKFSCDDQALILAKLI